MTIKQLAISSVKSFPSILLCVRMSDDICKKGAQSHSIQSTYTYIVCMILRGNFFIKVLQAKILLKAFSEFQFLLCDKMSHEPLEPPKYCFIRAPKNISTESIPSVKCLHHKIFFHEVRIYQKALENVYINSLLVVNSSREVFLPKFKYKKKS